MDHRGCDRVVARMRHLAQQGRLLPRTGVRGSHFRCVRISHARSSSRTRPYASDSPNAFGIVGFSDKPGVVQTTGLALLAVYNPFLDSFAILSLVTNVTATSLIAYKAWYAPSIPAQHSTFDDEPTQGTQTASQKILLRSRRQVPSPEGPRLTRRVWERLLRAHGMHCSPAVVVS